MYSRHPQCLMQPQGVICKKTSCGIYYRSRCVDITECFWNTGKARSMCSGCNQPQGTRQSWCTIRISEHERFYWHSSSWWWGSRRLAWNSFCYNSHFSPSTMVIVVMATIANNITLLKQANPWPVFAYIEKGDNPINPVIDTNSHSEQQHATDNNLWCLTLLVFPLKTSSDNITCINLLWHCR